jgi:hypothetical protein
MSDTPTTGALILSAWDQIAQDRRCDRRPFCRHLLGVFERLEKCDCLATADRRVRQQELESTK